MPGSGHALKATIRRRSPRFRRTAVGLAIVCVVALLPYLSFVGRLSAHEIPSDVTIRAFVKAEGSRLRLLVRVPLIAMRDMTWPQKTQGVLDLSRANFELDNGAMLWLGAEAVIYADDEPLPPPSVAAVRASYQSDRSFESYDQALALVTGPREPDSADLTIKDDFLDVLFEYPLPSERARIAIEPRWGGLGLKTVTIVRAVWADGERRFELEGDPGLVRLDPTWQQAARQFVGIGFSNFLGAAEPLLFLVCLVLPFRRVSDIAVLALAFAVAYSATFWASALGYAPDTLWFRPLIETLVAAAILYISGANIAGARGDRRWREAVWSGLIFGFAFAFTLHPTLQFAGAHEFLSLVAFDVGFGLGQLAALAVIVPLATLLFRFVVGERVGIVMVSAAAAHEAWHWLAARASLLWQYRFAPPAFGAAFFAEVLRWAIFFVAVAALVWLVSTIAGALSATRPSRSSRS